MLGIKIVLEDVRGRHSETMQSYTFSILHKNSVSNLSTALNFSEKMPVFLTSFRSDTERFLIVTFTFR